MEGEVSQALEVLLKRRAFLTVAGRTDAGVHAWGQVASYAGEPVSVRAMNALLPSDISVLASSPAPAGFDARRDATSRAYCYRVLARRARSAFWRGRALWWPHALDVDLLHACAAALVETHDFTAFTPTETDHVRFERTVYAAFWRASSAEPDLLEFWIEADAFMRHMNRVLVGTMLEVAGGRRALDTATSPGPATAPLGPATAPLTPFQALLAGQPRSAAGPTAPAHGLYLAGVGYDGVRVSVT